jgi:hypothetical protein
VNQIRTLYFAVSHPEIVAVIENIRKLIEQDKDAPAPGAA